MGSRAHASMLAQQGLITVNDRESILQGLDEIESRIEADELVWRSDMEDVHMNIEATLTDFIGEHAKNLHTARSRNLTQNWNVSKIGYGEINRKLFGAGFEDFV